MERRVLTVDYEEVGSIAKALASPARRRILDTLVEGELSIQEIAEKLSIPQSTCTVNVQILERAGLVKTRSEAGKKGARKLCSVTFDEAVIPLHKLAPTIPTDHIEIDMPIGLYTNCDVAAPCGLVSDTAIIGNFDQTESFLDPHRASAQLIWFTSGWLEYSFPVNLRPEQRIAALAVSCEICSEFPGYKNDWPSEITLWIEGEEVGTWNSPGDMGGVRGRLTPPWWSLDNTQYGYLKEWRVTPKGSFLDGSSISATTLEDLGVDGQTRIRLAIGVKEDAANRGGMNIFGSKFGNHEQHVTLRVELEGAT
jgi:predicted transcriptional regulator